MDNKIVFPGLGNLTLDPPRGFTIPGTEFTIYLYGVIIAVGLMLAVIYGLRRSKQFGIKKDDIIDGVLWIAPFAVICARAYYVISEWDRYAGDFWSIINLRNGGLAIYGGVIGAVVGIIVFTRIKKMNIFALLDLVALGFMIGQAVGRWGNFINREAFGCYADGFLAMQIAESNLHIPENATEGFMAQVEQLREMADAGGYTGMIQVHPTFLYESLWNAVGFVALHFLSKKRQYDGQIALGYVAWYGLGRTWIEGLRMDSLYWGPFRASQLLAAVTCVAAVVILLIMALRKHDRAKLYVHRVAAQNAELLSAQEEAPAEADISAEEASVKPQAEEAPAEESPEAPSAE